MINKKVVLLIFIVASILLVAINIKIKTKDNYVDISAWLVDWSLDKGLNEIETSNVELSSIEVFAAYFNDKEEVFLDKKILSNINKISNQKYLTVVNDIVYDDKTSKQKDGDIISRILLNDIRREEHINNVVDLVVENNFDGLELDYEKIDEKVWDKYILFIDEIGQKLKKHNKKLRVVLEARSPIDKQKLPDEYEYVMMAYNLYGYHSGPGPKADKSFIKNLCKKTKENLNNIRIAFSLGGFDWNENEKKPKALTSSQIDEIINNNNVNLTRDKNSDAIYFNYYDVDNNKHTVWYSDNETIKSWIKIAKDNGISKFALWRLGDNI